MISLSTVYNTYKYNSFAKCADEIIGLGFGSVELTLETPGAWLPEIKQYVNTNKIKVSGLHNICPAIEPLPKNETYYSAYLLTDSDTSTRKKSIALTKETITIAAELNAKYVVIHAGEIPAEINGRMVNSYAYKFGTKGMLFEKYRAECVKQRQQNSKPYINNLIKSLDEILPHAQKNNIMLGLENRFYYHEIPVVEDLHILFQKFNDAPVGYWHDAGHAEINTRLNFFKSPLDFLEPFKDKIIGFHLHDVVGIEDHFAPGMGEIDFKVFVPYIKPGTQLTIESHRKTSHSDLKKSLELIKKTFHV